MDEQAIRHLLNGRKYLLLQGPMGPCFSRLATWLQNSHREVKQVCFNAGDSWYANKDISLHYIGSVKKFSFWLRDLHKEYPFDTIVCFGDCRAMHIEAKKWVRNKSINFLAFEEGYFRPFYITLEKGGVNGYSSMPGNASYYHEQPIPELKTPVPWKPSTFSRCAHAMLYYAAGWFGRRRYPGYRHHKSFSPWYEMRCWIRAGRRKLWYRWQQRNMLSHITGELDNQYYLAILQVYNDSQIHFHSPYKDVREYIETVIRSFARHAPKERHLVFKHHPMDRGHRYYGTLIKALTEKYDVSGRVIYVHDISLPALLTHTRAVITVNSTAGLSALIHNKPLKVMGTALYDIEGLTWQGPLNQFWGSNFTPDKALFKRFRAHLLYNTQINAVFYGKSDWLDNTPLITAEPQSGRSEELHTGKPLVEDISGEPKVSGT
ncbi:capsular biosynthesis protein [Atlantibacter sp.]|uniref:capsule biosynthesis protein n=1 Tax=Atlantibacter sp. TaxID=1903473 RepID=UPI0028B1A3DA|nr:capsular biosynthesis protein [Atlantibacter sp.]